VVTEVDLFSPAIGATGKVVRFGHWGRPVLAFPSEGGDAWQFEREGMVGAIGDLLEAGRVKLYCVDSFDAESWSNPGLAPDERAGQHRRFASWITEQVVPFVRADCGGEAEVVACGASMGAFHAAAFALERPDLFPLAICLSGNYGPLFDWVAGFGEHGASLLLVCGQGQWEDTTGALESTRAFGALLAAKGIKCDVDLWGYDVPHDWPSWRAQLAHHLPRFL
jgi:esterase/lipase superfamily enzyme